MIYLVFINFSVFLAYGLDKWLAKRHYWRISENNLLLIAILGGSLGAYIGMFVFKHKIRKKKFYFTIPILCIMHLVLFFSLIFNLEGV